MHIDDDKEEKSENGTGANIKFSLVLDASGDIDEVASMREASALIGAKKAIETQAIRALNRLFEANPGAKFTPMTLAIREACIEERVRSKLPALEFMAVERAMTEYVSRNSDETGTKRFTVIRGKGGGIWESAKRQVK